MLNYELYTQGGFTSGSVAPRCDNPRTGATSASLSAGAVWGDRHCPLHHRTSILNFISREKEFCRLKNWNGYGKKPICFNRFPVPSLYFEDTCLSHGDDTPVTVMETGTIPDYLVPLLGAIIKASFWLLFYLLPSLSFFLSPSPPPLRSSRAH